MLVSFDHELRCSSSAYLAAIRFVVASRSRPKSTSPGRAGLLPQAVSGGSFAFHAVSSTGYFIIGDGVKVANNSGSYSYTKNSADEGTLNFSDSVAGSGVFVATFNSPYSGTFQDFYDAGGSTSGNFTVPPLSSLWQKSRGPCSCLLAASFVAPPQRIWLQYASSSRLARGQNPLRLAARDFCHRLLVNSPH